MNYPQTGFVLKLNITVWGGRTENTNEPGVPKEED